MEEKSTSKASPETKPTVAKKKGGSKLILIGCILVVCAVLTLCLCGIVLALFSNRNIPVFSSLVEKGENLATTEDQRAQVVQDDMKDFVFSTLLSAKKNPENGLVNVTATEAEIEDLISDKTDVDSMRFKGTVGMTESDSDMDLSVALSGLSNKGALSSDFDGTLKMQGVSIGMKGELRSVNDNVYAKFDEFPSALLGLGSASSIQGQWMSLPMDSAASTAGALNPTVGSSAGTTIGKADLEKIKQFIDSDEMTKNIKRVDDEVIEGVRTNCFEMDLDAADMRALAKRAAIVSGQAVDDDAINGQYKDGDTLVLNMCSGRTDGQIYKLNLVLTTSTPMYASAEGILENKKTVLTVDMKMWDYNSVSDTVSAPSGSVPMEQVLQQILTITGGVQGLFGSEE